MISEFGDVRGRLTCLLRKTASGQGGCAAFVSAEGTGDNMISSANQHLNTLKIIRLVTARTTTSTTEDNVRNVFELPKRSLEMILESEKNIRK